jgi:glucose/arabinose dehydrogenase
MVILRTLLVAGLALFAIPAASANEFNDSSVSLKISSKSIAKAVTEGGSTRGPALALFKDESVLLGGGASGGEILTWSKQTNSLRSLGKFIPANKRKIDSRFAINDIAILSESASSAKLLISYPRLGSANSCVEIAVDELAYDRKNQRIKFVSNWFVTKPCVPISAVQHTSGRFAVIDKSSVYVTIGDLGFSQIDDRSKRGDLGSIFKLTAKSAVRISQGHRNPQGILLFDKKVLLAAEHGPRGGDEINVIQAGGDYGWPFVSYGQPYGGGDYVSPAKTGSHDGYAQPIKYWVPSIAPTELVQLPEQGWGDWGGAIVLGTLREEVLLFMKINEKLEISQTVEVKIGERIRDLEVLSSGGLLATTDSGKLITVINSFLKIN